MADDTYSRGYRNDRHDRGGPSDSGPATDPLTELARLIGQADPFAPDRNRQPDPRQPDPRQSDAYPQPADWHADPAQHRQQYDTQHYEGQQYDTQHYEGQQHDAQHYAPQHYDGQPYSAQQYSTQHYDPQHYEHGAQGEGYATGEPQHYPDNAHGSPDPYASHQNGYAYPHAGQHEAGYDNAGYAEQPYPEQQAYHQEQPAYQHEPQAYHPDQHPYHQEQPAHGQEAHAEEAHAYEQPSQFAQAGEAPQQGEHAALQAGHQPVPGYPAPPPFFGSDPNARPDEYYEDAPAPRRGWLVTAAALVGLAVVGTAGAFAYRAVFTGGEARIISRDVAPNKIAPAQANQDNGQKTGDRLASAGPNEKLGPPPEQPITIPEPPRTVPPAITPNQAVAAPAPAAPAPTPAPAPMPPAAPAGPNQAAAPADTGGNAAPRRVRTEKINPQQQVGDVSGPRPGGPIRMVGPPSPVQPRTVPPDPNAPLSLAPNAPDPAPAPTPAPQPRVHTTAVAPPPPVERSSGGGSGFYVQLSAHKSEEEAKSTFRGIQARHHNLLGGQQVFVRRKDLGSKGIFYGAQVGPLSREAAGKLCEDLKAAGQTCMVQRN